MRRVSRLVRSIRLVVMVGAVALWQPEARAQPAGPDPRPVLATLIQAFQNCGPSNAYLLLGTVVYQAVWMQTGGAGCYAQIAAFGPVQAMTVLSSVPYPAGPIHTIRTDHPAGSLFWQIGISQFTQKVEHLTVNVAQPPAPPAPVPPRNDEKPKPAPPSILSDSPPRRVDPQEACIVYEGMCPPATRKAP